MNLRKIVIITGISGAGKTTTMQCLEDIGYFCVDNMPLNFIPNLLEMVDDNVEKIAFGVNIREKHLTENFKAVFKKLNEKEYTFKVIFLDADDQVILRRFSETRRKHPLSNEATQSSILNYILEERAMLESIKNKANKIINSSNLNTQKLKEMIKHLFLTKDNNLIINLISFGFKYGVPVDTDMMFDVRFMKNPYYDAELKPLTGNDKKIQDFVMEDEAAQKFMDKLKDMFDFLIPEFEKEGKTYLTVGIGCTGGKHRSVTIVNKLKEYWVSKNLDIGIMHRDIIR